MGAAITELGALQGGRRGRMVGPITLTLTPMYLDYISRVAGRFLFYKITLPQCGGI